MKYLLIVIWCIVCWVVLLGYLALERTVKVILTIIIFTWDFKYKEERYAFWDRIDIYVFPFFILNYIIIGYCKTMKEYLLMPITGDGFVETYVRFPDSKQKNEAKPLSEQQPEQQNGYDWGEPH